MNLNFHAPVELTYELLPLIKKKKGRVVNVTSVDGFISLPTNAAYNASKHAVETWSDSLRIEMMPWGVKVVIIQPSTMKTPLAMTFADNYRKTFREAPVNRRDQYGEEWIDEVHKGTLRSIKDIAQDPAETAGDLLSALQLSDPPTRIASGMAAKYIFKPLSRLPDKTLDKVLFSLLLAPQPKPQGLVLPRPPVNKISHFTIRVTNLGQAIAFYEKFGFETVHKALGGQQFMKGGGHKCWKPLLLLVEDKDMPPRGKSYSIGMTRLCLYSTNVDKEVERLESIGLSTMYPVADDKIAKIASYKDPDGFVVYIIQFKHVIGLLLKAYQYAYKITEPWLFHWTVNVKDSNFVNKMFEELGIKPMTDQNKDQVAGDLLPAFGLTAEETVIEHIRLARFPADHFVVTTMEWVKPTSTKSGHELSNSLSISVADVDETLCLAKEAGMCVEEKVEKKMLPYYGEVRVGTAYVEEGSNRIEFICF